VRRALRVRAAARGLLALRVRRALRVRVEQVVLLLRLRLARRLRVQRVLLFLRVRAAARGLLILRVRAAARGLPALRVRPTLQRLRGLLLVLRPWVRSWPRMLRLHRRLTLRLRVQEVVLFLRVRLALRWFRM